MSRLTAADRMRRLLAVIPWVSGRGEVALSEIADRFDYPIDRLRRDLTEVVQFVGVHPYTPDMLIEVYLDDDNERVSFALADYFTSPLRLTPEEGLSLVSAGLGLLGASVGHDSALERGLHKVADRFGVTLGEELDVSLGGADPVVVDQAMAAVHTCHSVTIDYYSLHRGETTSRTIQPHRVFSEQGEWYVRGFCELADEVRTFRLDRVMALTIDDATFEPVLQTVAGTFAASEDDIRVTLQLAPQLAWVAEAFPVEEVRTTQHTLRVTLAVSSLIWLERLLLQLGAEAKVVSAEPALPPEMVREAAQRVLDRYRPKASDVGD
ncbi:MAG: helix-turn-helix transcriptional regulator [Acidimicrobiales bacterium]|jgi:proteasome accessory factor C